MSNPGPNVTTTSLLTQENVPQQNGHQIGASASALIGFYGTTPIVQPTAAAQALVVDSSGGAAAPTNGILTVTGTYNGTIVANCIATLAAQGNAIQAALVALGIMKGS